jgi:UDP-glucose 4-epimerase
VTDLARAHCTALNRLLDGGDSVTLDCGHGRGCSVLQVIEAVKRASGAELPMRLAPRGPVIPAGVD